MGIVLLVASLSLLEADRIPLAEAASRVSDDIGASIVIAPEVQGEVTLPKKTLDPEAKVRHLADQVKADLWPLGTGSYHLMPSEPVKGIYEDLPMTRLLMEVSMAARVRIITPDLQGPPVTIDGRGDPGLAFFDRLSRESRVLLIREPGFVLRASTPKREKKLEKNPLSPQTLAALGLGQTEPKGKSVVSLDFEDAPVSQVAQHVALESGVPVEVEKALRDRKITLRMKNAPWKDALEAIAALTSGSVWDGGRGEVSLKSLPKITMEFHDADVRVVIDLVARNSRVELEVDETIQGNVSMNFTDLPWRDVIHAVARCGLFRLDVSEEGRLRARKI